MCPQPLVKSFTLKLFALAKVRAKIRSIDGVKAIINALQTAHAIGKDVQLLVNAVECICSLAEDGLF